MPITAQRPPNACLPPVLLDPVIEDPETIRSMARQTGPFFMPARYLVGGQSAAEARNGEPIEIIDSPSYLVGPVWRGDWAFDGEPLVDGADRLLHLPRFVEAAAAMCQSEFVVPEQVFVNLTSPMGGNNFSHTDIPEFQGIHRSNAPGWLLTSMGASGLFEDERITIITAVTWFYRGERGYFRYWPHGRDNPSVRHENMWNTGVVGDNDFMHHQVERTGPRDMAPPAGMTLNTTLTYDDGWHVVEKGRLLATYDDTLVRLSLSWKAKVYASAAERDGAVPQLSHQGVIDRFRDATGEDLPADLDDPALHRSLTERYTTYRSD